MAKPIVMRVIQLAFLGRASENIKVHPLLDLTPFHAAEFGVSRIHVAIYRTVNGMAIEDRVSSNGTWLNGVRLVPRKIYKLSSGDQLFLGRLPVKAYIGQTEWHTMTRLEQAPTPVTSSIDPNNSEIDKPATPPNDKPAVESN
jgi:predicted component of type VI protein secretion system